MLGTKEGPHHHNLTITAPICTTSISKRLYIVNSIRIRPKGTHRPQHGRALGAIATFARASCWYRPREVGAKGAIDWAMHAFARNQPSPVLPAGIAREKCERRFPLTGQCMPSPALSPQEGRAMATIARDQIFFYKS
ncbi:hypothetical protein WN943_018035 [Citrus x changshan-huyou]